MKKFIKSLTTVVIGMYMLSAMAMGTYYNWQYAKDNGFVKWMLLGAIVPTFKGFVWPYYVFYDRSGPTDIKHNATSNIEQAKPINGDTSITEYIDKEYGYAFLYPSNWKMLQSQVKNESGEMRVLMISPDGTTLTTAIGNVGTSITKDKYMNNNNKKEVMDKLINLTVDSVYKKASKQMGATRMEVGEKREIPSEIGVKYYISTLHFIEKEGVEYPIVMAGIHVIPFGKEYIIGFAMSSTLDAKAVDKNEVFKKVFNSFHMIGEKPL